MRRTHIGRSTWRILGGSLGALTLLACGIELSGGGSVSPGVDGGPLTDGGSITNPDGALEGDASDGSVPPAAVVVDVQSRGARSCVLRMDGAIKCWGRNQVGQLGLGDLEHRGDKPGQMGLSLPTVPLGAGVRARSFALGVEHACAILDDGRVKCWGSNYAGQLGVGDLGGRGALPGQMGDALAAVNLGTGRTATMVAAGTGHSCAILDNAALKCWGQNAVGQLGLGDAKDRGAAPADLGDALPPVDLGAGRTAKAVAAGEAHTCAILDNDTLKCWGLGLNGRLGRSDGDTSTRGNDAGEMGDGLLAIDLGTGRHAVAVGAGKEHTCAVLDNGTLKCWGKGTSGQLGQGNGSEIGNQNNEMGDKLAPVDLGAGRTVKRFATGWEHNCAVLDDNLLRCFGSNTQGQLGPTTSSPWGNQANEMGANLPTVMLGAGRTVVIAAAGEDHSCALLENGRVKCWGKNDVGQLGQGDTKPRGKNASDMADALLPILL